MNDKTSIAFYRELLTDIKARVRQAQTRAVLAANAEMILMYWDIGHLIAARLLQGGWGAGVIPRSVFNWGTACAPTEQCESGYRCRLRVHQCPTH